ncbi:hypothetical protein HYV21_02685 [Candidatus Microgenomates bacterium]|nr:hypothetical protein [Candidatus Microgenomates bacterium]
MIQREKERREQEAEAARLKAEEAQRLEQEKMAREAQENRHLLEELKIPEYLQSIIDEQQLEGAHVLWRKPTVKYAFPNTTSLSESNFYSARTIVRQYISHIYSQQFLGKKEMVVASVALVWKIHYSPGVEGSSRVAVDWPSFPAGYEFNQIEIVGNNEEKLIIVPNPLESRVNPVILFESEYTNPDVLKRVISSSYLDSHYHCFNEGWPFSEWVPEAEAVRDRIARGEETPVLPPSPSVPQRPSFWNQLLVRG